MTTHCSTIVSVGCELHVYKTKIHLKKACIQYLPTVYLYTIISVTGISLTHDPGHEKSKKKTYPLLSLVGVLYTHLQARLHSYTVCYTACFSPHLHITAFHTAFLTY